MRFAMILAETKAHGIGKDGHLPWNLPKEFQYFVEKTKSVSRPNRRNAVVMGRKTWDSMPAKVRPMRDRVNVVLSSGLEEEVRKASSIPASVAVCRSLNHALHWLSSPDLIDTLDTVFILGGAGVYNEGMLHPGCSDIYVTVIDHPFECDTFWAGVDDTLFREDEAYTRNVEENGVTYSIKRFVRRPDHPELAYLALVRRILDTGSDQLDRTGVGTRSIFGPQLRFDFSAGFPLLTTKKVFWRGVVEELLWFIRGATDSQSLSDKGVHIWDGNGTRSFLDSRGLQSYPEGQLGPVYGFQWRHFGAVYEGAHGNYRGKGVDQLADCIHQIRTNPTSRRIVMSAWNPADLDKMALPPCHVLCQFYVSENRFLSCHMYQRSADMGLGVPFNIASYALLTYMMAHVCSLQPRELVLSFGDAHVYKNHFEGLEQQLLRKPLPFPKLKLNANVSNIDDFKAEDIELIDYNSHPAIKLDMAI